MKYLAPVVDGRVPKKIIDTLYLSPLLFPKRPYHNLHKDYKLQDEEFNNPVLDSEKAKELLFDEVNAFWPLSIEKKKIFCGLLYNFEEFQGFFDYVEFKPYAYKMAQMILDEYKDKICANADIEILVKHYPKELAYALALIGCDDYRATTTTASKNTRQVRLVFHLAERVGFEPTIPFRGIHDFQSCSFDPSDISP